MKKTLLVTELLFLAAVALTVGLVRLHVPAKGVAPIAVKENKEIIRLLASGKQDQAEKEVAKKQISSPGDIDNLFWKAVLLRSRFYDTGAMKLFIEVMKAQPQSPIGLASACIVGVDLSKTSTNALHYFNALMILAKENPDSIPINWMAAVMARTLTRTEFVQPRPYNLPETLNRQVLVCGIEEYRKTLSLMAPGKGPVLIHQTMANLFDDLEAHEQALDQRELALSMERRPWSLHAAAVSHMGVGEYEQALKLVQEAIDLEEQDIRKTKALFSLIKPLEKAVSHLKSLIPALEENTNATMGNIHKMLVTLTSPPELQTYYKVKGDALWNLGRKEEALAAYEKGSALNPSNPQLLYDCQFYNWRLGRYREARQYSQQALRNDPKNRACQIYDARLAVLTGEPWASERVMKAGEFDFNRNALPYTELEKDPWFAAALYGDVRKVRGLIPSVDVNAVTIGTNSANQTALMSAAKNGWEPMVADLLKAGAKTDIVDANGDTALHYSVQFVQPRTMQLLLDAGANPNIKDRWQQTPLSMAAYGGKDQEIINRILEKKPDVNIALGWRGSAIHGAAKTGGVEVLKKLILHGGDVNLRNPTNGETPLMAATVWNFLSTMNVLLAAGADPNARDNQGKSELYHAIQPGVERSTVDLLLQHGADPTVASDAGITPIARARLLGYEDIAIAMESKAGRTEPFVLPPLGSPNLSLSAEENNAALFTLPLVMARGLFPGGFPPSKREAIVELRKGFGINNADEFHHSITALEGASSLLLEACRLSLDPKYDWLQSMLTAAVWKIQESCLKGTKDDAAWSYARMIYLSELAVNAGYVSKEEASRIISEASKVLAGRFSSWQEFLNSLLLGVRFHEEWEAPRYKEICRHIMESGIPWPREQEKTMASPAAPTPAGAQTPQEEMPAPAGSPTPQPSPTPVPQPPASGTSAPHSDQKPPSDPVNESAPQSLS